MLIVVEPGRRSIETALKIDKLARDIGLRNIAVVVTRSGTTPTGIYHQQPARLQFLGFLPTTRRLWMPIRLTLCAQCQRGVAAEARRISQALLSNGK